MAHFLNSNLSFFTQAGKAVKCPEAKSIASGLAPPFAGENAFRHIKEYVQVRNF
jgi:hypothetical protein